MSGRSHHHVGDREYLFKESERDAGPKEFAQMLRGELAKGVEDVDLDLLCVLFVVAFDVGDGGRGEIGAVDGIVDGYGDFVLGVVVDGVARDASPHWLEKKRSGHHWEIWIAMR